MADEQKTPVAIRITRPYATEQEYLEREFDTLTRTSVVLLGAQPRPQGVVLRFEIVLKNGDSMLRGEGRVVGFKEKAYAGEPGLSLRFTRLDARSKALVDRAAALRDARVKASSSVMGMPAVVPPLPPPGDSVPVLDSVPAPSSSSVDTSRKPPTTPIPPPRPSRAAPPPLPEWARSQVPPAPPSSTGSDIEIESTQVDATFNRADPPSMSFDDSSPPPPPSARASSPRAAPPPLPPPAPTKAARPPSMKPPRAPTPARASAPLRDGATARIVEPPPDREALLIRLRARGRSLPEERVREILAKPGARP